MTGGTVYGSSATGDDSNTATNGAALYKGSSGAAQYGTFTADGKFIPASPDPNLTSPCDSTITVTVSGGTATVEYDPELSP